MKIKRSWKAIVLSGAGLALLAGVIVLSGKPTQGAPVMTVYKTPA